MKVWKIFIAGGITRIIGSCLSNIGVSSSSVPSRENDWQITSKDNGPLKLTGERFYAYLLKCVRLKVVTCGRNWS